MARHSAETRIKLSQGKMGVKNPNFGKFGISNPLFGRRIRRLEGSNNPKWRGGVTDLNNRLRTCTKTFLWRKQVFERDRYRCTRCGDDSGGNLEAHHVKPYHQIMTENCISNYEAALACVELWEVDNGLTLCEKCHIEISRGDVW